MTKLSLELFYIMGVQGGMKCLKILMLFFNLLFAVAGLAIFIVGILVQVRFSRYVDVLGSEISKAPYVCIAVGAVIFIIAFFGCCGAWKENHCMMMTFATLMTLILILEVVATALAVVYKDQVKDIVQHGLEDALPSYDTNEAARKAIDAIQKDLKCCGVSNYTDWNGTLPESCCYETTCNRTPSANSKKFPKGVYDQGCLNALGQWCVDHLALLAGVAGALCVVEILGILFACCLARAINSQYEVV